MSTPKIVTTDRIPSRAIDPDALKVIRRLRRYGHEAYLVGGCVRDLLLGFQPKDFDVITSARPRQVRRLFSNSRVIGRRFRLVHVIFGDNVVEVSTFRADPSQFTEATEAPASTDEPESRDAEDEADIEGEAAAGPAEDDEVDDEDTDSDEGDEDDEDDEAGEDGPPATLSEIGELVQTVHDPLDPDDPGPAVELEPGEDGALLREVDERAPGPAPEPVDDRADDEDVRVDDVDDRDDRPDDDEDDGGRRRGRGARDEDIDANNLFGDPEQDARRRDFTINALFYDPDRNEIIDYTGGLEDLERKLVTSIRDPEQAFVEDPVRMIRAARFAAKLGFTIEAGALATIERQRHILADCSQRRLLEEVLKILKGGYAARCVELLISTGLIDEFLPDIAQWLAEVPPVPPRPPVALAAAEAGAPAAAEAGALAPDAGALAADAGAPAPDAAASEEVAALTGVAPPDAAPAPAPEPARAASEPGPEAPAPVEPPVTPAQAPVPAQEAPPATPSAPAEAARWGPSRRIGSTSVTLYPRDAWRPDRRMVDAFLRVTWERPPLEGANDWVEDPQVYLMDGIFEAAAFARDVVLEETGHGDLAALTAERSRAAAVLKVLRWNGRLEQMVASFAPEEPSRSAVRRARRRRGGRDRDRGDRGDRGDRRDRARGHEDASGEVPAQGALTADLSSFDRRTLLLGYLEGLDRLNHRGVPLTPAVQLSVLFAPMLLTRLEDQLRRRGSSRQPSSEELADDLLFPIARRHSLARRDRDRVKRIVLSLRRMLSGELRRRARHGGRMGKIVTRDYFREAIVVLWLHCRATSSGWDEFRYWEGRAKPRGGR